MTNPAKKLSRIYVFGNPLLKEDSLPVRLLPKLRGVFPSIEFIPIDPTENLPEEKHFIIIDTIINLKKMKLFNDVGKIELSPSISLHDFDLGLNLKLMKKLGKINDVSIIGIPPKIDENKALEELNKLIPNLLLKNEKRS